MNYEMKKAHDEWFTWVRSYRGESESESVTQEFKKVYPSNKGNKTARSFVRNNVVQNFFWCILAKINNAALIL